MADFIETIIIGGGQAGLATSYYLGQMGREHLVLEQAKYSRAIPGATSAGIRSPL